MLGKEKDEANGTAAAVGTTHLAALLVQDHYKPVTGKRIFPVRDTNRTATVEV